MTKRSKTKTSQHRISAPVLVSTSGRKQREYAKNLRKISSSKEVKREKVKEVKGKV